MLGVTSKPQPWKKTQLRLGTAAIPGELIAELGPARAVVWQLPFAASLAAPFRRPELQLTRDFGKPAVGPGFVWHPVFPALFENLFRSTMNGYPLVMTNSLPLKMANSIH